MCVLNECFLKTVKSEGRMMGYSEEGLKQKESMFQVLKNINIRGI